MRDSDSIQEIKNTAVFGIADFFSAGIKEATIEQLESGLFQMVQIRQILLDSGLTAPARTWTNAVHIIECELLERTLLK